MSLKVDHWRGLFTEMQMELKNMSSKLAYLQEEVCFGAPQLGEVVAHGFGDLLPLIHAENGLLLPHLLKADSLAPTLGQCCGTRLESGGSFLHGLRNGSRARSPHESANRNPCTEQGSVRSGEGGAGLGAGLVVTRAPWSRSRRRA